MSNTTKNNFKANNNKNNIIKMRLSSYDYKLVDASVKDIIEACKKTGARISGPIMLPTTIVKQSILRSPHIFKKAMDQFEIRTHRRLIYIIDPNDKTIDEFIKIHLAPGVFVKII